MKKQVTIELEEGIYNTLEFIAESLKEPVEEVVIDGLYNHVASIEDSMKNAFGKNSSD